MRAMYNRESKNMWIVYDDGSTEEVGQADTVRETYVLLDAAGFMRMGDWLLVASGSPLRVARIQRK
ncbi:hypothetical protein [Rhodococcus sp. (in: high G+C Gram-positive bacteria)]|uniref:hypothetical protein n=1 Tax=Rhodococcus sp. TaxID=1831 RepID=UPI003BB7F62F